MKTLLLCLFLASEMMGYSLFETKKSIDNRHLNLIHTIKDIVITTQKTRGLTNNYMNGNVVAQLLVHGQRKEMMKNFAQVDRRFKELELPGHYYQDASKLMLKSKKLNKKAFKNDSAKVFAAYSSIIEAWMDLNEAVITTHFSKREPAIYQEVKLLNNVLLPLTENIGKMRGMGSGIVARGYCQEKEAIKMQSFVDEIQRYTLLLENHMSGVAYTALGQNEFYVIRRNINDYAELTLDEVIGKSDIKLITNEYFDQGTAAISDVLKIYNVISSSLK